MKGACLSDERKTEKEGKVLKISDKTRLGFHGYAGT